MCGVEGEGVDKVLRLCKGNRSEVKGKAQSGIKHQPL